MSAAGCLAGCECEPDGMERCEYRLLADVIIEWTNPPDGEDAEVSICIDAVERMTQYVITLPCVCTPDVAETGDPCGRCAVLGRVGDQVVDR